MLRRPEDLLSTQPCGLETKSSHRSRCHAENASKCNHSSYTLILTEVLPSFCRVGFTCRCIHSTLFGVPVLPGGQAQYARIPKAGGTLFSLTALAKSNPQVLDLADSSLLLLADILPTGVFAALQALQHPKLSPILTGSAYPSSSFVPSGMFQTEGVGAMRPLETEDRTLTIAIVGLGPVGGVCSTSDPVIIVRCS